MQFNQQTVIHFTDLGSLTEPPMPGQDQFIEQTGLQAEVPPTRHCRDRRPSSRGGAPTMSTQNTSTVTYEPLGSRASAALEAPQAPSAAIPELNDKGRM